MPFNASLRIFSSFGQVLPAIKSLLSALNRSTTGIGFADFAISATLS